jgi:ABC-2 type transport system ATP-binding protein
MLQISNLTKTYGRFTALDGVTFNISDDGVFALLGVNGAGKTTLVSILCNIIKADSGEILYDGEPFFEVFKKDKSLCSLAPQEFAFYPTLSVRENINFFSQLNHLTHQKRKSMVDFAISVGKLESHLNARADRLSGGLKRRLNLAIALLNDPKILFLDEPTTGIDPHTREFILGCVQELSNNKKLIIYTSHYMNEVDFLAKKGAIIDKGKILTSFEVSQNRPILTVQLQERNEKNIKILNSFMSLKEQRDALVSDVLDENKAYEFLKFAKERDISFKKISFEPLSIETLFLKLTNKEFA